MEKIEFKNLKNEKILNIILEKVREKYLNHVDFIGVFGSTARGEDDDYSNLDLAIVTNPNSDLKIDYQFVLNDNVEIGYRFASKTWAEYESLIGTVWAGEILQVKPVYFASNDAQENYLRIKRLAEAYVLSPLNVEKMAKIVPMLNEIKIANSDVQIATKNTVKFYAIKLLLVATETLTLLNCGYYRFSLTERIKDIEMLSIVPKDFKAYYKAVLTKTDERELKQTANFITAETIKILTKLSEIFSEKLYDNKADFYEDFITKTNSKFIRSQLYADKQLSSLVSYEIMGLLKEIKKNCGKDIPHFDSEIFGPKMPFAIKSIKTSLLELALDNGGLNVFNSIEKAMEKF